MTKNIEELKEFIERAVKSRKYPESTAQGLRAALKLFEGVLNTEENSSIEVFKKHINQIYQAVVIKNGKTFSSGSLAAYKSRVLKIINDYESYGIDPTKMASWSPKPIMRGKKKKSDNEDGINKLGKENPSTITNNIYNYKDSGNGWEIVIKSVSPITSVIKKQVIEISDLLEKNK